MAVADFTGLGDCIRLYTRSGAGFTSSGDGTDITGWTDDSSAGVDTISESNAPTHDDTPPGGYLAPAAEYADETDNGFSFDEPDLSGGEWTFGCTLYASSLTSFRNIFSSQGGAAQGSLYTNGGLLTYQEASTDDAGASLSTGTLYTIVFHASATEYVVTVRNDAGTEVINYTFSQTPTTAPGEFKIHTYAGNGAGWAGHGWAYVLYDANKSANDTALHSYLLAEAVQSDNDGTIAETGLLGTDAMTGTVVSPNEATIAETGLLGTDTMVGGILGEATIAETGLLGTDSMVGTVVGISNGTIVETGLLGTDAMVANAVGISDGTIAETGLLGTDAITGSSDTVGTIAETGLLGTDSAEGAPDFEDDFAGTGDLVGWFNFQSSALPSVSRAGGRYLAELDDNTADITLWFNANTGQGIFRWIGLGTEIIVINIGIGVSSADTQTAPSTAGDPVIFAGLHFNEDLDNPTDFSAHVVAGNRGGVFRTVESKITVSGTSSVGDEGFDALGSTNMRCDMRAVLDGSGDLYVYFRAPNSSDPWVEITWPAARPNFASGCFAGLITYAAGTTGVPFVGTADSVSQLSILDGTIAETGLLGTDEVTATAVGVSNGTIAETGLLGTDAVVSTFTREATIAETGLLGTDALTGAAIGNVDGTIAETGLLGTDSMTGTATVPVNGTTAETGLLGTDALTGAVSPPVNGTIAETGLLGVDSIDSVFTREATIAETGLLGTDAMVAAVITTNAATIAESGLLAIDEARGETDGRGIWLQILNIAQQNAAAIATKPTAAEVDAELTAQHGAGSWVTSTATSSSNDLITANIQGGGTASVLSTNITGFDDGYFDRMLVIVESGANRMGRRIRRYEELGGSITLETPLPFTPGLGDTITIVAVPRDDPTVVGAGS